MTTDPRQQSAIGWAREAEKTSTPIVPDLPRSRPFPLDALPRVLRDYVGATAAALQVDPAMVALPVLTACAGAIGATRRLTLKPEWSEYPIVWGVVVARSGSVKSSAMDAALWPLRELQDRAFEEHEQATELHGRALREWESRNKKGMTDDSKPVLPVCRRFVMADATVESAAPILRDNPRGVMLARDELRAFLAFDRYKGAHARGGEAATWLEAHRGGQWIVDRKTTGMIYVRRAVVSVVGTIQPSILRLAVGGIDGEHVADGLLARFLLAMPPERAKRWSRAGVHPDVKGAYCRVIHALAEHAFDDAGEPVPLFLSPDAEGVWAGFYEANDARRTEAATDAEAAMLAKVEAAAARLALIVQLASDPASDAVDAESMGAGVALAHWFADEAGRLYSTFGESSEQTEQRRLVEWIDRRGGSTTLRDLTTSGPRRFRSKPDEATAALKTLEDAGLGRWVHPAPGEQGGRPSARFVLTTGSDGSGSETPAHGVAAGGFDSASTASTSESVAADDDGWGEV